MSSVSLSRPLTDRFRKVCESRGYSARRIARELGLHASTVSRAFARGLTLQQLARYSEVVGVQVSFSFAELVIDGEPIAEPSRLAGISVARNSTD